MFYHYGEIRAIKVVPRQQCAFVEFTTRDAAERAAKAKYNNCVIKVCNQSRHPSPKGMLWFSHAYVRDKYIPHMISL